MRRRSDRNVRLDGAAHGDLDRASFGINSGAIVICWLPPAFTAATRAYRWVTLWWTLLGCLGLWLVLYGFPSWSAALLAFAAAFGPASLGTVFARPPAAMSVVAVTITLAIVVIANFVFALAVIPDAPASVLACYAAGSPSNATDASFAAARQLPGIDSVVLRNGGVRITFDIWTTDDEVQRVVGAQQSASPYVTAVVRGNVC